MEKITKAFLQARIDAGDTHRDLKAITGLTTAKVRLLLDSYGLQGRRGAPRKLPPVIEIVARLQGGEHPRDIAAAHGVTVAAVYHALRRQGIEVRDHFRFLQARGGQRRLPPFKEIVQRIEMGEHPSAIAAEAGVRVQAVHSAVQRGGTNIRDIREGRYRIRSGRRGRYGFPDFMFQLRPGHGLGGQD
jgi:hypothetical protein